MRVHIAIFDRSTLWSGFKEDIYVSLKHWFEVIGHRTTMAAGRLIPGAFNVVVGVQYLTEAQVALIADSGEPYGLYDVEILDQGMVNFKPETRGLFSGPGRRLFERSRFVLTPFRRSVRFLHDESLPGTLLEIGRCPPLLGSPPLAEAERDIDILFFGHVDPHRAPILQRLAQVGGLVVRSPENGLPMFLRNEEAARARIVLSLGRGAPFGHVGPMRLAAMAHLEAFTLSETPSDDQPEIADLAAFIPPGADIVDEVRRWLGDPAGRAAKARRCHEQVMSIRSEEGLARCLDACRAFEAGA